MFRFTGLLVALALAAAACGGDETVIDVPTVGNAGDAADPDDDGAQPDDPPDIGAGEPATTEVEVPPTVEETTTTEAEEASPYLVNQLDEANRGAETSQQASNGQLPVQTYERFELAADDTVGGVEWLGIYSFCDDRDGVPDPHASAFLIEIYADGANGPDLDAGPLLARTFDVADTDQTIDDTFDQPCLDRPESTWAFYRYNVELAEPFVSEGGVNWLLIQAVTPGFETYWGWQSASIGGPSLQEFNGEITEVTTGGRAYALVRG